MCHLVQGKLWCQVFLYRAIDGFNIFIVEQGSHFGLGISYWDNSDRDTNIEVVLIDCCDYELVNVITLPYNKDLRARISLRP